MKYYKFLKSGSELLMIHLFFIFIINVVYGFSEHEISASEKAFRGLNDVLFYISVIVYFTPLLKIYQDKVKRNDKNKKRL